ncbi:hypothetical protein KEM55_007817, partial [Ascosphaera atra]
LIKITATSHPPLTTFNCSNLCTVFSRFWPDSTSSGITSAMRKRRVPFCGVVRGNSNSWVPRLLS